jgi:hypothetical protein
MPQVFVQTNQAIATRRAQQGLGAALSERAAVLLGCSESECLVTLESEQRLVMAGSDEPCAMLELDARHLPRAQTPHMVAELSDILNQGLDVPYSRIIVQLTDPVGQAAQELARERRSHFRVNTQVPLDIRLLGEEDRTRPWVYSETKDSVPPVVQAPAEQLEAARESMKDAVPRALNLSAGGLRLGEPISDRGDPALMASDTGDRWQVRMQLGFEGEKPFGLIQVPGRTEWADRTPDGKMIYVGIEFQRVPDPVERLLAQFVLEVERRRLRTFSF